MEPATVDSSLILNLFASDPTAGLVLMTVDGRITYANEQAARLFSNGATGAPDFVGKSIYEILPRDAAEHRLAIHQRVRETGQSATLRVIWHGWQQLTWVQYIRPAASDRARPEHADGHFLLVTRRVGGSPESQQLGAEPSTVIELEYARLGPLNTLSARELEVLALIGEGQTTPQIAKVLHRSEKTIEKHRASLTRKLHCEQRLELAEIARRAGLTLRDAERIRI
ncbi:MAG: PAS and helix-turn-helix domain-containing protein [Phycisphaerae bacterium]|nr:PAS and helix-turn-helix domain-containing protein [Phycisphaerae bacterium]